MSEFVFLYRGGDAWRRPEILQKQLAKWLTWFRSLESHGVVKDAGQPLEREGKVVRGSSNITDGPYAETKDLVGGYTVIEARDLDHAAELASGCPILDFGGMVEVRPVKKMNLE